MMVIHLSSIYSIECQWYEKMYIREINNIRSSTNVHIDYASKYVGLSVSIHIYECTKKTSDENEKI